MKARVERSDYVFKCPVGYRYEDAKGQGKVLIGASLYVRAITSRLSALKRTSAFKSG